MGQSHAKSVPICKCKWGYNICQVISVRSHSAYVNTILNSIGELSAGEEETTPPHAKHTKRHNQGENSDSSDGEHHQFLRPLSMKWFSDPVPYSKQITRVFLLMYIEFFFPLDDESMDVTPSSTPSAMKPSKAMDQDRVQVSS